MKITEKSFPHPVLSNYGEDVLNSAFQCTLSAHQDRKNYYLTPSFVINNQTIKTLVSEGKASYFMHLECASTFYRSQYQIDDVTQSITIKGDKLKGKVEANFFVCATQRIDNYMIAGAHKDYAGLTFSIRKGDILAVAESATFHADKTNEQIKPLSSIMRVRLNEDEGTGIFSVTYDDFININMPKAEYDTYFKVRNDRNMRSVLGCLIALPVLIDAIAEIKRKRELNDIEASRDDKWFRILEEKLEGQEGTNMDEEEPIILAQKILENPLRRGLNELFEISQD